MKLLTLLSALFAVVTAFGKIVAQGKSITYTEKDALSIALGITGQTKPFNRFLVCTITPGSCFAVDRKLNESINPYQVLNEIRQRKAAQVPASSLESIKATLAKIGDSAGMAVGMVQIQCLGAQRELTCTATHISRPVQ